MKIGMVGLGQFYNDFVRLFNLHPDVEEVVVADLYAERVLKLEETINTVAIVDLFYKSAELGEETIYITFCKLKYL